MPLSPAQRSRIRKIIAREAKTEISRVVPDAGILTDLGMEPQEAGFMLAEIMLKLDLDFRPIYNELEEAFAVTKRGSLTKASKERIAKLLPGVPIPAARMESIDDLWSVAMVETLFEQSALRLERQADFEPISSKRQQAWKRGLRKELGERKLRLLLAATCRHAFFDKSRLTSAAQEALDLLERYADTGKSKKDLRAFRQAYSEDWYQGGGILRRTWQYRGFHPFRALYDALDPDKPEEAVESVANAFECVYKLKGGEPVKLLRRFYDDLAPPLGKKEKFADEWRTPQVVTLATSMYESRNFGKMKQLASALGKAGCTSQVVLDHCRDTKTFHNRGCWVVDAILNGNWPGFQK